MALQKLVCNVDEMLLKQVDDYAELLHITRTAAVSVLLSRALPIVAYIPMPKGRGFTPHLAPPQRDFARLALDTVEWYNVVMEYKSNHNVVYSCKYHVVWCPKYRRKVLVNGVDVRLKELIEEICNEYHIDVIEMEIMPDHVHLLMEVDPQFGVHKAVKQIKGRTSRVLRQEFGWLRSRLPTLWTNSYFVSTVGGAPLSVIKQYIENQKNV